MKIDWKRVLGFNNPWSAALKEYHEQIERQIEDMMYDHVHTDDDYGVLYPRPKEKDTPE